MAATVVASSAQIAAPRKAVVARKSMAGTPVVSVSRKVARVNTVVRASAERKELAFPAGVTAGLVAIMAHPLYAEASVTPSLKNLLNSVVAGALVLGAIFGAVTLVSNFDPVSRK